MFSDIVSITTEFWHQAKPVHPSKTFILKKSKYLFLFKKIFFK